jgi:predicted CXXCH cytochrome family protein
MQKTLDAARCTDCHEEHRGTHGIVVNDMRLCLGCHRSLEQTTPAAGVPNVDGFPSGHPQFRLTVVADAAGPKLDRVPIDRTPPPLNRPGIKFSHAAHLVEGGFPVLGYKPLGCNDCHIGEPGGQGFRPVTYKQQCAGCHALDFERQELPWPNARVPHGDDIGVAAAVWNFYAGKAVQGGMVETPPAPVTRRAPGAPVRMTAADSPTGNTQQWVAEKTEAALRTIVLDDKRGCAYCHFGTGADGAFAVADLVKVGAGPPGPAPERIVAPVVLRDRFLPQSRFDHAKHAATDCEQCHAARTAEAVGQMVIPGIKTCLACHGAERATSHVQSTCTTCHRFHSPGLGPMRSAVAGSAQ